MQLSQFIKSNIEPILVDWEAFARTMIPPAETMTATELRDHAREILLGIADGMDSKQSEPEREAKSKGLAPRAQTPTFSSQHGDLRQRVGFDLSQLGAEYRALRATVLRLWMATVDVVDGSVLEEVIRFNEGIDQALAEAMASYSERVANSRDTFLAVLGHDLRNPMSALASCVRLLGLSTDPTARDRTLRIARQSIASINGMVTDLLEYTRTRLGRGIEVNPEEGDLAALSREVFDEVSTAYPSRVLHAEIPDAVHFVFDVARMRQVLTNLMVNAVQYGDAAFPVLLQLTRDTDRATMTVRNQGVPIPPDAMQVIFNPLVQVTARQSQPHERPATSLGLGLYIAREIVTGHGGTIAVSSSLEEGTAFSVQLPG
ncbi:sensor histidine kinase [Variovorax sp. J22P168]|uniref:sensor histidine kinase n=1 Tax=Variovorax jilinensis TaxID=3053513 RepID=UPI0025766C50|nr:sensor histidine kinase [Variovorax sp. J22P168]MDM0014749.1 sensor histidine kinase [Variovorax sp. J22P168]